MPYCKSGIMQGVGQVVCKPDNKAVTLLLCGAAEPEGERATQNV